MSIRTNTQNQLDSSPVSVRAKLAAAWTSFMFLYIYVDVLGLYKPGVIDGILNGRSVEENINISARRLWSRDGFIRPAREAETAETQIARLRIRTPSRHQDIVNLSGGNQQKVILGRWLAEEGMRVLIMDEPTRGIDVGAKYEIYVLMKQVVENGGSIIMISSELPEVLNMSNRVLTICEGRITGEFNPETVSAQTIMDSAIG